MTGRVPGAHRLAEADMDEHDSSPFDAITSDIPAALRAREMFQLRFPLGEDDTSWTLDARTQLLQSYRQLLQAVQTSATGGTPPPSV